MDDVERERGCGVCVVCGNYLRSSTLIMNQQVMSSMY